MNENPDPDSGSPDPDPGSPANDDGQVHDLAALPFTDELGALVSLVHALRYGDAVAAARLIIAMDEGDTTLGARMLLRAAELLGAVANDNQCTTAQFARWARVADARLRADREL